MPKKNDVKKVRELLRKQGIGFDGKHFKNIDDLIDMSKHLDLKRSKKKDYVF